jgi:hypothetical protein
MKRKRFTEEQIIAAGAKREAVAHLRSALEMS